MIRSWHILLGILLCALPLRAAEVIPPPPTQYVTDYAGVIGDAVVRELDQKLRNFEAQTSNQVWVVVYPKMQSDSSIEDYTVRVAQKWGVGQKDRRNGVVLFVFVQDRKMYIQVGYGLEGALPDATAKSIIENELKPRFKANNYGGGLRAGVDAIVAATKGEYKALPPRRQPAWVNWIPFLIMVAFILLIFRFRRHFRSGRAGWGPFLFTGGGGSYRGGSWGGGGGFGGGGGGFGGGGGSFGGGGAGGSW